MSNYQKYLKYKKKYLLAKQHLGGGTYPTIPHPATPQDINNAIEEKERELKQLKHELQQSFGVLQNQPPPLPPPVLAPPPDSPLVPPPPGPPPGLALPPGPLALPPPPPLVQPLGLPPPPLLAGPPPAAPLVQPLAPPPGPPLFPAPPPRPLAPPPGPLFQPPTPPPRPQSRPTPTQSLQSPPLPPLVEIPIPKPKPKLRYDKVGPINVRQQPSPVSTETSLDSSLESPDPPPASPAPASPAPASPDPAPASPAPASPDPAPASPDPPAASPKPSLEQQPDTPEPLDEDDDGPISVEQPVPVPAPAPAPPAEVKLYQVKTSCDDNCGTIVSDQPVFEKIWNKSPRISLRYNLTDLDDNLKKLQEQIAGNYIYDRALPQNTAETISNLLDEIPYNTNEPPVSIISQEDSPSHSHSPSPNTSFLRYFDDDSIYSVERRESNPPEPPEPKINIQLLKEKINEKFTTGVWSREDWKTVLKPLKSLPKASNQGQDDAIFSYILVPIHVTNRKNMLKLRFGFNIYVWEHRQKKTDSTETADPWTIQHTMRNDLSDFQCFYEPPISQENPLSQKTLQNPKTYNYEENNETVIRDILWYISYQCQENYVCGRDKTTFKLSDPGINYLCQRHQNWDDLVKSMVDEYKKRQSSTAKGQS